MQAIELVQIEPAVGMATRPHPLIRHVHEGGITLFKVVGQEGEDAPVSGIAIVPPKTGHQAAVVQAGVGEVMQTIA